MSKRALIYARVSTDEQAEKGYSLPSQLEAMRTYAAEHEFMIPGPEYEITDDYSGAKLDRPGLDQVRALIARREVEAVIVNAADRLTRNLAHSLLLREEWQRAGVELHYCNRGKSENTPESQMTENIEAVFGDYWRAKIIEGSRRGRRTKAANGKWVGIGHTPYGYRAVGVGRNRQLVIEEAEAEIVRKMFRLYLGLDGQKPLSAFKISWQLSDEGVSPPCAGRIAKGWYDSTIKRILKDRKYIGEFSYAGQSIDLPELAIVDPLVFEAAQARRKKNSALATRSRKHDYLLSGGYLRCTCGINLVGQNMRGRYFYYRCCRKAHHLYLPQCNERYIKTEVLDRVVWDWILSLLKDDEALRHGIRRMAEREATELQPKRERLALLEELIAKEERKIARLIEEFSNAEDAIILDALREKRKEASKNREALVAERVILDADLSQKMMTPQQEEAILEKARALRTELDDPDFETKRYFLDRLGFHGRLSRDKDGALFLNVSCRIAADQLSVEDSSHCRAGGMRIREDVLAITTPQTK